MMSVVVLLSVGFLSELVSTRVEHALSSYSFGLAQPPPPSTRLYYFFLYFFFFFASAPVSLCDLLLLLFFFAINNRRLAPSARAHPSKSRVSFHPGLNALLSPFVSCKRRRRRRPSTLASPTLWPPDGMGSDDDDGGGGDALPTARRTGEIERARAHCRPQTSGFWFLRPRPAPPVTAHETTLAGRPVCGGLKTA